MSISNGKRGFERDPTVVDSSCLTLFFLLSSGAPISLINSSSEFSYGQITASTGCDSSDDRFKCLQDLSADDFNTAMNAVIASGPGALVFSPVVDGSFIPASPDKLVREGKFVKDVTILNGK